MQTRNHLRTPMRINLKTEWALPAMTCTWCKRVATMKGLGPKKTGIVLLSLWVFTSSSCFSHQTHMLDTSSLRPFLTLYTPLQKLNKRVMASIPTLYLLAVQLYRTTELTLQFLTFNTATSTLR